MLLGSWNSTDGGDRTLLCFQLLYLYSCVQEYMITTFSNKTKGLCKLSSLAPLLTSLVWVGGGESYPGAESVLLVNITS